ncbi:MAG: hypothetical protein KBS52_02805 [Clostridiales bacterium]|nr:hypothetical protein [Candidatus Equinaster intestinalis]
MLKSFSKFFILLTLIATIITLGVSCDDIYKQRAISDIAHYDEVWELPESHIAGNSKLFPKTVKQDDCLDFNCRHLTYKWVGSGWELVLKLKYDDSAFAGEKERIATLCAGSPVCGESQYFDLPAYASVWGCSGAYEYAIIDDEAMTVSYVYLQLINRDVLELNRKYLPKNYEDIYSEGIKEGAAPGFAVYDHLKEKQTNK